MRIWIDWPKLPAATYLVMHKPTGFGFLPTRYTFYRQVKLILHKIKLYTDGH